RAGSDCFRGACEATPRSDCVADADGDVRGKCGTHGALRPSRVGAVGGDECPRRRRVAPMTLSTRSSWMLYGAYGTTGRLIVDEALRRGHRPVLAGRDSVPLSALGQATGLSTLSFSLDDGAALRAALSRV